MSKSVEEIETEIVQAVIRQILGAGFQLSVNNGGDSDEITLSTNFDNVFSHMFAADEDYLKVFKMDGSYKGMVYFIYGEYGWDVINDYSVSLEPYLTEADKISQKYANVDGRD